MIGYVTIGTNDLPRAAKFYDALLGEVGAKRMMENEQFIAWSVRPDKPGLGVTKPFDQWRTYATARTQDPAESGLDCLAHASVRGSLSDCVAPRARRGVRAAIRSR